MENKRPDDITLLEKLYGIEITEVFEKEQINHFTNTFMCNDHGEVTRLALKSDKILNIDNLPISLEYLSLTSQQVAEIEKLPSSLKQLSIFCDKVSSIKNLPEGLESFCLSSARLNRIENLPQSLEYLWLSCFVEKLENLPDELRFLTIYSHGLRKIENLPSALSQLNLHSSLITKIPKLPESLFSLNLSSCNISRIENIPGGVYMLDLSANKISLIENLPGSLCHLWLEKNKIARVQNLPADIRYLRLASNRIKNIENLPRDLMHLNLSFNLIESGLETLNENTLPRLEYLEISNNPVLEKYQDVKLVPGENHLDIIRSLIKTSGNVEITLPAKVLLLGNHHSGKSTFAKYYIRHREPGRKFTREAGTHVLDVINYPQKYHDLPEAVIYDFGGQDYYHGIYKAFMTNDSVNLVFWQSRNDNNRVREDHTNKGLWTQDFRKEYWLHQLRHYATIAASSGSPAVYLVQTHADDPNEIRECFKGDCRELGVKNEFYIGLTDGHLETSSANRAAYSYLEETLNCEINDRRRKITVKQEYLNFIKYTIKTRSTQGQSVRSLYRKYEFAKIGLTFEEFRTQLQQLSRHGMALYYPDNPKLKNTVWLNPSATVKYIHEEILTKEKIRQGRIAADDLAKIASENIIQLLVENKVIFLDVNTEKPHYIIPGYLPMAKEQDRDFFVLADFDKPNFTLFFEDFIPFGVINQLICFYGPLPEKKEYWRDQLIFTTREKHAKVLINLDFENLLLRVYVKSIDTDIDPKKIEREILDDIILILAGDDPWLSLLSGKYDRSDIGDIYFSRNNIQLPDIDEKISTAVEENAEESTKTVFINKYMKMNFEDIREHIDRDHENWIQRGLRILSLKNLYISTDDTFFTNLKKLEECNDIGNLVAYPLRDGRLSKENGRPIYPIDYRHLSVNPIFKKMKKIFISYSSKDSEYLEKLKEHLKPLKSLQIIETWDCTQLRAGYWDEQIQMKLEEADIVLFMISPSALASDYICNKELLPSFVRARTDPDKKLMFVMVRNFALNALTGISDIVGDIEEVTPENMMAELPKYQFMPKDRQNRLTPVEKWPYVDDAFVEIVNQLLANIR